VADLLARVKAALVDRYAVEREIGRGGMALVFLATELHPRRQVAIKVLDPDVAAALGPDRFLREVDLASKLTYPHILPIFAAGEAEGLLYYTMPHVTGESLRERIEREKQLPLADAVRIAREVADALGYADSPPTAGGSTSRWVTGRATSGPWRWPWDDSVHRGRGGACAAIFRRRLSPIRGSVPFDR